MKCNALEKTRLLTARNLDGRIILRRIFRKWEGVVGTGWSWLRIGRGGRALASTVNELSGSIKCGELLD